MASLLGAAGLRSTISQWWGTRRPDTEAPDAPSQGTAQTGHDRSELSRMMHHLVIPKLVAGLAPPSPPSPSRPAADKVRPRRISAADVDNFAKLCVHEDAHVMLDCIDQHLRRGLSVETLYLDLLAPAARQLGRGWETDRTDFVTVTMALWRIQEVLRELSVRVPAQQQPHSHQRCALFSTMPGEQHSFGTLMVADCFERAGWLADVLIEPERPELTGKFASIAYDLIGLTVSCDCSSAALAELVKTIRTVSRNPKVKVLLGGRAINLQPSLAVDSGADGTAVDAVGAVRLADELVPVMRGDLRTYS